MAGPSRSLRENEYAPKCCLSGQSVELTCMDISQLVPVRRRGLFDNKGSLSNRKRKVYWRLERTSCNFRPWKYFTGNECGEPRKWHRYDSLACRSARGSLHQTLYAQCKVWNVTHTHYRHIRPTRHYRQSGGRCYLRVQLSLSAHASQTTADHRFCNTISDNHAATLGMVGGKVVFSPVSDTDWSWWPTSELCEDDCLKQVMQASVFMAASSFFLSFL